MTRLRCMVFGHMWLRNFTLELDKKYYCGRCRKWNGPIEVKR